MFIRLWRSTSNQFFRMHFFVSLLQDIKRDVRVPSALNRWVFVAWISTVTVSGSVAITECSTILMLWIDHAVFSSSRVFMCVCVEIITALWPQDSCSPAWKVVCLHGKRMQGIISVIRDHSTGSLSGWSFYLASKLQALCLGSMINGCAANKKSHLGLEQFPQKRSCTLSLLYSLQTQRLMDLFIVLGLHLVS